MKQIFPKYYLSVNGWTCTTASQNPLLSGVVSFFTDSEKNHRSSREGCGGCLLSGALNQLRNGSHYEVYWNTRFENGSYLCNDKNFNRTWFNILEDATCQHFHSPAFRRLRFKHLGSHTFYEPGELSEIYISRLNKFVADSRRFVEMWRSFWLQEYSHDYLN